MEPTRGSVVLEWTQGVPPRSFVFYVEDILIDLLRLQPDVGALDGNEVGPHGFRIFLYGADGEVLWRTVEPVVRKLEPPPITVTIAPGGPDSEARKINLAE